MAVVTKPSKSRRTSATKRTKRKIAPKNGRGKAQTVKQGGVYMLRPRRTPQALRRAKRLAELVRQELAAVEQKTTLDETMKQLRGPWWSP